MICGAVFLSLSFLGGTTPVYAQNDGELPESMYLQAPVSRCSGCAGPVFEREGDWEEDTRCYACWAMDRNKHSIISWTPPQPYCVHCGNSTLGNVSGFCDDCIKAACGNHTQTVLVKDKKTGKPVKGAAVTAGVFHGIETDSSGKVAQSEEYMHLDGKTVLTVSCPGYQKESREISILELSNTVTVELEPLQDSFTVPIKVIDFAAEALGPVALDIQAEWESLPFPIKVKNLLENEITLTKDTGTGEYIGAFKMDGLAQMLFEGEPSISGKVTARWDEAQERLELTSADVDASMTFSGNLSWGLMGLDGELPVQIQLTGVQQEDGQLELIPRISCSGSIYAYLGVKLESPVKVGRFSTQLGAEATGGVVFNIRSELANGHDILQDYVQLTGNLQAKVKLLGWERTWPGFYWQYYPIVEDGRYEIPSPIERFPPRNETGTDNQDSQKFDPDTPITAPEANGKPGDPVVEDSGSNADPVIVPIGGGSVVSGGVYTGPAAMFWLKDASERQDMDRYMLVYSIYDGKHWSEPIPIYNDGTADFAPRAVTVGDTIYVIWQNADQEFSGGASSEEYALSMDLYAAVIQNGKIQGVTNLTEDISGYCGMHSLTVQDGKVCAAWVVNSQGDLLFSQGQNQGYESVYEAANWKTSFAGETASRSFDLLKSLSLDTSSESRENNIIEAAGASFYVQEDGSIACKRDGKEQILIPDANTASFEAITNGRSVFLYWLRTGEEGAFKLDGAFYDSYSGQCSQAQTYLDHGTMLHGIHASMDAGGTVLMAYQSSQWEDIEKGTYRSSDLLAAVFASPLSSPGNSQVIQPMIIAGAAIFAALLVGVIVWVCVRRKKRKMAKYHM